MTPLSQLLRESSRGEHSSAESRPFITRLMAGELDTAAYIAYLANLRPVYQAIETTILRGDARPGTISLWDTRLNRVNSIDHDLAALGVSDGGESLVARAARDYSTYLRSISGRDDIRMIAHHYTRYLGDLSGGQAIGALVGRHYRLEKNQLSFCNFSEIENLVHYKEAYRTTLDEIPLIESERQLLVDEVKAAFAYNQAIFDDLGELQSAE
jgi:heme oxygenase